MDEICSECMLLGKLFIFPDTSGDPPSLEVITPSYHLQGYLAGNGPLLIVYRGLKRGLRERNRKIQLKTCFESIDFNRGPACQSQRWREDDGAL